MAKERKQVETTGMAWRDRMKKKRYMAAALLCLAVLFSGENDFLLIDEPTNHLDQEARETVKQYLGGKKSFLLVSHDKIGRAHV